MNIKKTISQNTLIIITSIFLVASGNSTFFNNVADIYPISSGNLVYLISLSIFFVAINILLFSLACFKLTIKPVLIIILLLSSLAAYFMDAYNVIIDDTMIDNILKTDLNESLDLLSFKQGLYFIFLGVIPSLLIYKIKITTQPLKKILISRLILIIIAIAIIVAIILSFGNFYASFFREHKPLRFYANPSYYIYSSIKYATRSFKDSNITAKPIALDAKKVASKQRKLFIFIVGETARADHFSLNGYAKDTNPLLNKENVISFTKTMSCGTSTAYSVPCMFSLLERSNYSKGKAKSLENVLDILQRVGVNVLWLDNNSSSKGVADRVPQQDYKSSKLNPICDPECRDEGMLKNLQPYIDSHPSGDIVIVLHQMGNHGPAYYKRYPKAFEKFKPICKTNQLELCGTKQIINAYDNAILYTDYFLAKTIAFLKKNNQNFDTSMLYVSDHGESLGENNLYLHGLPYVFAPNVQKHVPMIIWLGKSNSDHKIEYNLLKKKTNKPLSHDNLFHSILGLMNIKTSVYKKELDIFAENSND